MLLMTVKIRSGSVGGNRVEFHTSSYFPSMSPAESSFEISTNEDKASILVLELLCVGWESSILSESKLNGKSRQKNMKLWIFATSNNVDRLSIPLRSRFMELYLDEYTYEEFIEIVRRLLKKRYQLDVNLSGKIGHKVWNQMKSKDIRDAINIAKLTKSASDADWLVDVQMKYGRKSVI